MPTKSTGGAQHTPGPCRICHGAMWLAADDSYPGAPKDEPPCPECNADGTGRAAIAKASGQDLERCDYPECGLLKDSDACPHYDAQGNDTGRGG